MLQHPRPIATPKNKWYTVRIKTFKPTVGGVNLCLINAANECVFKRLDPPFDRGIRDDCFEAPDIGDVVTVLAAPETGSWGLDDITLNNEKRFPYNDVIGGRDGDTELAALMTKTRPLITLDMKELWDEEYIHMKMHLLGGTMQITALGTAVTAAAVGIDQAAAFATGGTLALMYALMLQWEIDAIGRSRMSYTVLRLASLFGLSVALTSTYHENLKNDNTLFVFALIGFMSYKISIARFAARHEEKQ